MLLSHARSPVPQCKGLSRQIEELAVWQEVSLCEKMARSSRCIITSKCALQLVAEAVPHVEGAPCLGGHNRAELPAEISTPEAAAAYLETLSAPPDSHR